MAVVRVLSVLCAAALVCVHETSARLVNSRPTGRAARLPADLYPPVRSVTDGLDRALDTLPRLRQQSDTLVRQDARDKSIAQVVHEQNESTRDKADALVKRMYDLECLVRAQDLRISNLEKENRTKDIQIKNLTYIYTESTVKIAVLEGKVTVLNENVTDLVYAYRHLVSKYEEFDRTTDGILIELKNVNTSVHTQLMELDRECGTADKKITEVENITRTLDDKIVPLGVAIGNLRIEMKELDNTKKAEEENITMLAIITRTLQEKVVQLEKTNGDVQNKFAELDNTYKAEDKKITSLEDKTTKLEENIEQLDIANGNVQHRFQEFAGALEVVEVNLEELDKRTETLEKKVIQLESTTNSLQELIIVQSNKSSEVVKTMEKYFKTELNSTLFMFNKTVSRIDQNLARNVILFENIPEGEDESYEDLVDTVVRGILNYAMDLDITHDDIADVGRVFINNSLMSNRAVAVQFVNHRTALAVAHKLREMTEPTVVNMTIEYMLLVDEQRDDNNTI